MSQQAVRNQMAEAQKIASGSGSEADIAEAKIELEVGGVLMLTKKVLTATGPRKPAGSTEIVYSVLCHGRWYVYYQAQSMRGFHVQQLEGAFQNQPKHSKLCRLPRFLSSCLTIRIECTHIQQQPYTSLVIHFYLPYLVHCYTAYFLSTASQTSPVPSFPLT